MAFNRNSTIEDRADDHKHPLVLCQQWQKRINRQTDREKASGLLRRNICLGTAYIYGWTRTSARRCLCATPGSCSGVDGGTGWPLPRPVTASNSVRKCSPPGRRLTERWVAIAQNKESHRRPNQEALEEDIRDKFAADRPAVTEEQTASDQCKALSTIQFQIKHVSRIIVFHPSLYIETPLAWIITITAIVLQILAISNDNTKFTFRLRSNLKVSCLV